MPDTNVATPEAKVEQPTKRERELELQIWRERMSAIQNASQTLQIQAQLLQHQAKECQAEIARLEAALATPTEGTDP